MPHPSADPRIRGPRHTAGGTAAPPDPLPNPPDHEEGPLSTSTPTPQRRATDKPASTLPEWIRNFTTFPRLGEPFDEPARSSGNEESSDREGSEALDGEK